MKVLFVIGLIALLLLLMYRRLRPYLQLLREFIKTIRHLQTSSNNESAGGEQQRGEKLVRCEACDIWIPPEGH